jgi:hypothetical protein
MVHQLLPLNWKLNLHFMQLTSYFTSYNNNNNNDDDDDDDDDNNNNNNNNNSLWELHILLKIYFSVTPTS